MKKVTHRSTRRKGSPSLSRSSQSPASKSTGKRTSVRERILSAACERINEKGFSGAGLKDIAAHAGLTEPTIYLHFQGKEDLLFSVVELQVLDSLSYLDDQLRGISGAHNKLRKLVMAHLRYNDLHKDYLRLVLLECRSNLTFYKSKAYQVIRRYSGEVLALIQAGVDEGIYPSDLNTRLLRDIILGALDFEAYTVLVTEEIPEAAPDHEHIMLLLDHLLLQCPEKTENTYSSKRAKILNAAAKAFASKGYSGATISGIAGAAEVSDGTVYEYFKNKEDLLLSIPEEHFRSHLSRLEQSFHITDPVRKLRRFIQYHFRLYLDDYDFLVLFLMQIQLKRTFYKTRASESLKSYMSVFEDLVSQGIRERAFLPECNVRVYRNLFFGAFTHMALRWFVVDSGKQVDKVSEINQATNYFLNMIMVREGSGG